MTILYSGNPDGLLTYTSPSPKLCMGPSGTYRYGPHNLYVNSASPANQSITVVSGATYTVVITGSVSVTASGAATGTWTAGTTDFTAATGTLTLGSTSGAGTVHVRRTNSDTTYLATAGVARFGLPYEWNTSGTLLGILCEEQRTNWFAYSNVTNTFLFSDVTLSESPETDPTGRSGAVRITTSAGFAIASKSIVGAGSAAGNTFSVFARQGSGPTDCNEFLIRNSTTATNLFQGTINYTTGVWTTASGAGLVTVRAMTNGWWRIEITVTAGISASDTITCYCGVIGNASLAGKYTDFWLPQLERGAWATSPIETFGSTVTRAIDLPSLATTATPFDAAQGTIFVEAAAKVNQGSMTVTHFGIGTTPGNASTEIVLGSFSLSFGLFNVNNSGGQASLSMPAMTVDTTFKQAAAYAANDFACSGQGSAVQTDNSGSIPSALTTFQIGYRSGEVVSFNGYIRKVMYLPRRMSNAELQTLTT